MLIRVNKKISSKNAVQYAALSSAVSATTSGVWHDEDTSALGSSKRRNRIRLTRDMSAKKVQAEKYDA
jgi:hypothetical protein